MDLVFFPMFCLLITLFVIYVLEDFISFSFRTSVTSKDGKRSTKCTSSKGTPTKGNLGIYLFIHLQGVLKTCVCQGNKSQLAEELLNKHGDAVNKGTV